jgi:hypothetical protein
MSGLERRRARRRTTIPGEPPLARGLGAAALALGGGVSAGGLALRALGRGDGAAATVAPNAAGAGARGLYAAAALLALSVFADSAVEHYRGEYRNPGMYTPLITAAATLVTAAEAARAPQRRRTGAAVVFGAAAAIGAGGLGFHLFNIRKRPGRFNWLNLFYAAPIGAPAALSLAGILGFAGRAAAAGKRTILGLRLGRALAGLSAVGLAGTVGEAALLHFRGAFQNPFMWLPVSLPPVGAALLARAATEAEAPARRPLTRAWLGLTAALGIGGVGFHIFGVSRAMGGWRNWRQNMVDGPPIPAPPAFTALSIAGLAALELRDREALA